MIKRMLFIMPLLFLGCAQKNIDVGVLKGNISKRDIIKVENFKNNTSTPLAGEKVAAIVRATLRNKGFMVSDNSNNSGKFIVKGSVNEWRYKTGIDGEPAVNFSLRIINNSNQKMIFSGMGSTSGDGYDSLGTVAQKIGVNILSPIK